MLWRCCLGAAGPPIGFGGLSMAMVFGWIERRLVKWLEMAGLSLCLGPVWFVVHLTKIRPIYLYKNLIVFSSFAHTLHTRLDWWSLKAAKSQVHLPDENELYTWTIMTIRQNRINFEIDYFFGNEECRFPKTLSPTKDGYMTLAEICAGKGIWAFQLRPKIHMFGHLVCLWFFI